MARRKFSKEEVEEWRKEHNRSVFYINKNDSNVFVGRKYGVGWTYNLAHPVAWIVIAAIAAIIVLVVVFRIFHQ